MTTRRRRWDVLLSAALFLLHALLGDGADQ